MVKRTERVASLIRRIVAETIQTELSDPRIPLLTSITRVEVSADLEVANIYVSVYEPEIEDDEQQRRRRELCVRTLRASSGHLRRRLGAEIRLRRVPALNFRLDESVWRAAQTVELIDRVMRDSRAAAPPADATVPPDVGRSAAPIVDVPEPDQPADPPAPPPAAASEGA